VGEWVAFTQRDWLGDQQEWEARVAALGFPVFVKPCRAGSSLGVSRVDAPADLAAALDEAMRHDPRVIVEAACPGREVECGVLGTADGSLSASAIGEIRVLTEGFYDYESKYFAPQAVQLDCPADLPEDVARAIQKIALVAFEAVEGGGDFPYRLLLQRRKWAHRPQRNQHVARLHPRLVIPRYVRPSGDHISGTGERALGRGGSTAGGIALTASL
jgi:D-alanine--D-alanine ligase